MSENRSPTKEAMAAATAWVATLTLPERPYDRTVPSLALAMQAFADTYHRERVGADRADAARYRFLRPHLASDGDVDDATYASRHFAWVCIPEDRVMVPDAVGYPNVDAAIDAAILTALGHKENER